MWNPPNPTEFNRRVYALVRRVPVGHVVSYKQLAVLIPPPEGSDPEQYGRLGARWVGSALRVVRDETVPWWRVINSKGEIRLPTGSTSANEQRRRLLAEQVAFDAAGRVDLHVYGWQDWDAGWLAQNGYSVLQD